MGFYVFLHYFIFIDKIEESDPLYTYIHNFFSSAVGLLLSLFAIEFCHQILYAAYRFLTTGSLCNRPVRVLYNDCC